MLGLCLCVINCTRVFFFIEKKEKTSKPKDPPPFEGTEVNIGVKREMQTLFTTSVISYRREEGRGNAEFLCFFDSCFLNKELGLEILHNGKKNLHKG